MRLTDDFVAASDYARRMRDRFLSRFYQKYAVEGRYVYIDKSACSTVLQRQLAVDTVLQAKDGSLCIEEKIEQWPGYKRENFALETDSCTVVGREKQGWMHYAQADYLLYAFAYEGDSGLDVYLIDFPKLRAWFWGLPTRYPAHVMEHTLNHTRFEKVPIVDVRRAVPTARYLVTDDTISFIPKRGAA